MVRELDRIGATHFVLPLASKNPFVIRANVDRLAALIAKLGVDIVHARSRAPAWSARYAAKRTGRHFVTTFHNAYGFGSVLKRRYNAVMATGERVIAISNFVADHVTSVYGVPPERSLLICRTVRHPLMMVRWLLVRCSALIGLRGNWNWVEAHNKANRGAGME